MLQLWCTAIVLGVFMITWTGYVIDCEHKITSLPQLEQQVQKLQIENEALRNENARLRRHVSNTILQIDSITGLMSQIRKFTRSPDENTKAPDNPAAAAQH